MRPLKDRGRYRNWNQEALLSRLELTLLFVAAGSPCTCQQDRRLRRLKLITSKEATDRAQEVPANLSCCVCPPLCRTKGVATEPEREKRGPQQIQKVSKVHRRLGDIQIL